MAKNEIDLLDRDEYWAVAPLVAYLVALPLTFMMLLGLGYSGMAYDSCNPEACRDTSAALRAGVIMMGCTAIPLVAVWLWPHSLRFRPARWWTVGAYVVMAFVAMGMLGSATSAH